MGEFAAPAEAVSRSRRYAAVVRIGLAVAGAALLLADPSIHEHRTSAYLGLAVIGITGVVEALTPHERWLRFEEAFSCIAAVCIVGLGEGEVTVITFVWLVAAAVGVLARGGRVGAVGRVLVVGALLSPLFTQGRLMVEAIGLAVTSIALLLAVGRISRETERLLGQARYDADHDALTGLLASNAFRAAVDDRIERVSIADPAALVLIDLDDFGAINKRNGHAAGDEVLRSVARAIEEIVAGEAVVGRVGGDEFAVFAVTEDGEGLAGRLIEAAASLHAGEASGGVALCPQDGEDAEGLLAAADVALRVAKRSGKRRASVYWGAPLSATSPRGARAELERLLDGQGLVMAAQPIVDLSDGVPHAYEALARFNTSGGEGPLHWLSLADELGMRPELELACLTAALALVHDLPGESKLSVNLSASILTDPRALQLLRVCSSPDRLIVEVTEETLVRHGTVVEQVVADLGGRGTLIAVDDLGAGYAGLGQLAALRPSYVKLDRSLVRHVESDPARTELVRLLVEYTDRSGGRLVAEGVETAEELAVVQAAGAPLAQGYLFARPGPPFPAVNDEVLTAAAAA